MKTTERQEGRALIKRKKYGNKRIQVDNLRFDSQKEATRYSELKMLLKAGEIEDLRLQPIWLLQEGFKDNEGKRHRPITYKADFQYKLGEYTVIEDVKSPATRTSTYQIKKKMLIYQLPHGYVFREVLH